MPDAPSYCKGREEAKKKPKAGAGLVGSRSCHELQRPDTEQLLLLQVRFFLHAPLQLATVLLAAATAQHICTAVQASTSGAACLSLISAQQLVLGLLVPSFLTFMLDFRVGKNYMPHIQAKSWAVIPS